MSTRTTGSTRSSATSRSNTASPSACAPGTAAPPIREKMDRFLNVVKSHAAALDRGHGQPRFATVASVDPARYAARVSLQPEGVLTGWLPILTPWVGAGWGLVCPPSPGDQVLVLSQEGDGEHGVIAGGSFSDIARPPAA